MENVDFEPFRRVLYGFVGICIGIVTVAATIKQPQEKAKPVKEIVIKEVKVDSSFSEEALLSLLKSINIRFYDIVYAQAVIETGHFRSKVFKEGHNLFGMKVATQRPTTALGEHRGHAKYSSWEQSVIDYALFQAAYLKKCKTRAEYFEYLERNYAEDPNYVKKVKSIAEEVS